MRTERADHKITPSQLQALGHLRRHGPMSAARLAHHEQVTPQSIARTLAILEDAGLVTRSVDPTDARAHLVSITEQGLQVIAEDSQRRVAMLTELLHRECSAHERDILFLAGRIMRQLAEAPREQAAPLATDAEQTSGSSEPTRRGERTGGQAGESA